MLPPAAAPEIEAKPSRQPCLPFHANTGHINTLSLCLDFFVFLTQFLQPSTLMLSVFLNHLVIPSTSSYVTRLIASKCLLNLYTPAFYIQQAITPIKLLTFFWRPVFPLFVLLLVFSLTSSICWILALQLFSIRKCFFSYSHFQRVIQHTLPWISWWSDRKSQLSFFLYWLTNISST